MMHQKSDFISRHHGRATLRALICIVLAAMLAACSKEPVSVSRTDNQGISVDELFTHKGVTVYRFYDANRWVYFTSTASDITSTHQEYCGKGCTHAVTVETKGGAGYAPPK
ncbi:DUF4884 domain-containing protein [Achromobacter spanius]|uniref:DUF4884 domain-containing protein n=1 Tax=Achromobacter spanius TaxID=217203 RepID=A0AA42LVH1_9BURK|nr:DUF4884 domain-containing protein [Achromobacter spanius]MDH0740173.1 DUF4884 domain-containing protein [Achromobacter spanius]